MARRRMREHSLQIAVAHMLDLVLDPWTAWFSAIDHGVGRLGPAEAGIRKARGVKRGLPDFIVMWQGGHLIGIELKAGDGRPSQAQSDLCTTWVTLGFVIYLAFSLEDVQAILEQCNVPLRRRMTLFGGVGNRTPIIQRGGANERAVRPAAAGHQRARRSRKPKNHLPVVLPRTAQKK